MSFVTQARVIQPGGASLSEGVFQQLRTYIYERTGIFFADNKKYLLESRVSRRLLSLGVPSFESYYRMLTNGQGSSELVHLINTVTINETFFFRNDFQFAALQDTILPELIKKRRGEKIDRIRIWSAACSTGEEPYTIAMVLKDKIIPRFPSLKLEIVASDINSHVLDVARKGTYKEYAIRAVSEDYLRRYFVQDGDKFHLHDQIKKMVDFRQVNLFDRNTMRSMRRFDIIFAANVLIYFDFNSKQAVISSVYNSLNKGGYLLVGNSETLYGVSQAFKPIHFEKAIAYRKE